MYRYDPYALTSAESPLQVETFVAPDDFNPDAQEFNILKAYQKYKRKDKRYIYSIVGSAVTTTIPGFFGVYFVYSENGGAYIESTNNKITWTPGSTKRHIIAYAADSVVWAVLPLGAEWLYVSSYVKDINAYSVNTLKYIHCESLASITSISSNAFNGCNLTGRLSLPPNVTDISDYAFYANINLQYSIIIPDGVIRVGHYAFYRCSGFTGHIYTPPSVKEIGQGAFRELLNAQGPVYLSENLESIGNAAFMLSANLRGSLEIPIGVTRINTYTFYGCTGLDGTLALPGNLTSIDEGAFSNCGFTGTLHLPTSLVSIGPSAFANCTGFTGTLQLGTGLTMISNRAFYACSGLTGNLVIPNNVTIVASYAFANCTGLHGTLTIGSGVSQLYGYTFQNCSFTGTLTIPSTLLKITDGEFTGNGFNSISLGTGLQEIASTEEGVCGPFMNLPIAGVLNVPPSLTTIGPYAFYGCGALTQIPKSFSSSKVISIGKSAFEGCVGLSATLSLPLGLTNLGPYAFKGCIKITGLNLSSSLFTVRYGAFKGCTSLTGTLTLRAVTSVEQSAFAYCNFTSIVSNFLESIGGGPLDDDGAFSNNKSLKSVPRIPTLTNVGDNAFFGCYSLNDVTLVTLTYLGQSAFNKCTGLRSFTLENTNVIHIGDNCLKGCSSLEAVRFPATIPHVASDNVVDGVPVGTCVLYVPADSIEYYQVIAPWLQFVNILELL